MSRVAKNPIRVPAGVTVQLKETQVTIEGAKGRLSLSTHPSVMVAVEHNHIKVGSLNSSLGYSHAGTARAILNNMVYGVSQGYERKLVIVGVGYRASAKGNLLSMSLGFSHPIEFTVPEGISVETPAATEIWVKGADKQLVGQVAADIRSFRPPEPYKGKGVRYADEVIIKKETKKK